MIHLHIDRVIVDAEALAPRDAARLHAALREELERMLAAPGLSARLADDVAFDALRGGSVRIDRAAGARPLARQLAGAVCHGLEPVMRPAAAAPSAAGAGDAPAGDRR